MASNISFKDEDWNVINSTVDVTQNISMTSDSATQEYTITITDSNNVTTTTTFVGGRPKDRA